METSKSVLSNMVWRVLEQCGSQGIAFVVSIILARILSPDDYGTVALITVITSLLNIFINSGMGSALVQKKDADDLDFSTLFFFNLAMCTVLYVMLFLAAPYIALFYNRPELTVLTRVAGIILLISGIRGIQQAYVSRNMLFKRFFYATLGGTIGAAIISVWMALHGFGVWALVVQALFNNFVDAVILWLTVKWHPKWMFSWSRLKNLFSFGSCMLGSYLIDKIYSNIRTLLIGKVYSSSELAYYNRGKHYPNLIEGIIETAVDSVLFPAMSNVQENIGSVKTITRRAVKTSSFVVMPIMLGFAACAEPLVRIVLTEKWVPSVFFMRVFCCTFAFTTINTANLNAIKALGRSDIFLKLNLIKKSIGIVLIVVTMFISVKAVAIGFFLGSMSEQVINAVPNKKLLKYGYRDQIKDIYPQLILSILMYLVVYPVTYLGLNDWGTLIIQIPLGMITYYIGARIMKVDSRVYIIETLKMYLKKGRK